jgi:hypothetical protein
VYGQIDVETSEGTKAHLQTGDMTSSKMSQARGTARKRYDCSEFFKKRQ